MPAGPYSQGAPAYVAAGWVGVLPVGFEGDDNQPIPGRKSKPIAGYSGDDGAWPRPDQIAEWTQRWPQLNIGLRLPSTIVGLDVDAYVSARTGEIKRGAETLARLEDDLGPLPATWRSTARDPANPSGVRLYRVPEGTRLRTAVPGGIEVIQRHHRYLVCWPSTHPEGGTYRWIDPAGDISDEPPTFDDDAIPELPFRWLDALAADDPPDAASYPPPAPQRAARSDWSQRVQAAYADGLARLRAAAVGGRHDTATAVACGLCRHEQLGSAGATSALEAFGDAFVAAVAADRADHGRDNGTLVAQREYRSIVASGRRTVASTSSTVAAERERQAAWFARQGGARRDSGDSDEDDEGARVQVNARPLVMVSTELVAHLAANNEPPQIFVRSGTLTRVRLDEAGRPLVEPLSPAMLRNRISQVVSTVRVNRGDGEVVAVFPPMDAVHDILAFADWPFPALDAITEMPTVRPDGSIHDRPGYDPATRNLYIPRNITIRAVPEDPAEADIATAVEVVEDVLVDFPFDSQADKANAIGLLLTPLVRPAISGQVPLALVDAPQPGTGKSYLASLASVIATGRLATARPLARMEEEVRKMLTAVLIEGPTLVVLDNMEETIRSSTLAAVLTSDEWTDRVLGRSATIAVPNRATWVATGNNMTVGGDIGRRCYRIRLDAHQARPWNRTGWRHPQLLEWALEHRSRLVMALLVIARAWWASGQPSAARAVDLGGFSPWAHTIGGILERVGIEGFLADLDRFQDAVDVEAEAWEAFLLALHHHFEGRPVTAAAMAAEIDSMFTELRYAVPAELMDAIGRPVLARRLGEAFRRQEGRRYGPKEMAVLRMGQNRMKVAEWAVHSLAGPSE